MNIWHITKKDLQVILRDRTSLVWLFVLPIVFLAIFGGLAATAWGDSSEADSEDTRTPLVVINENQGGDLAERFLVDLDRAGGYRVVLSQREDAEDQMRKVSITRYLVLPANFSADLAQGKPVSVQLILHPDANVMGTQNLLQMIQGVAKDTSLELQLYDGIQHMGEMQAGEAQALQAFDPQRVLAQAKSQFERSRVQPLITIAQSTPAKATEAEAPVFDLSATIVPGMAVLFVFLAAPTVARSIYEERKMGSLRRLLAAPLTRSQLLLGKMAPILLLTLAQVCLMFLFGGLVLPLVGIGKLGVGEDPLAWAITSIIIALCSTSLGIMIAAVARSEAQISGLSNALMWVAGFLGGALIPVFLIQQIPVLNILSRLVPQYWAIQAYYDILARGKGLADVLPALGILLVFSGVFFLLGVRRFRFE